MTTNTSENLATAVEGVLNEAGEPLHYSTIAKRLVAQGYWERNNTALPKSPGNSVSRVLSSDINTNGDTSTFIRVDRGTYWLRTPATTKSWWSWLNPMTWVNG